MWHTHYILLRGNAYWVLKSQVSADSFTTLWMALDAVPDFSRMVYKDFSKENGIPTVKEVWNGHIVNYILKGLNLFFYFDFGSYKRVG